MSRALFSCAPLFPSLTIDINVLDFVKRLFLHMPHNLTGWCEALEDFLSRRGYWLDSQVCFRHFLAFFFFWFYSIPGGSPEALHSGPPLVFSTALEDEGPHPQLHWLFSRLACQRLPIFDSTGKFAFTSTIKSSSNISINSRAWSDTY